MRGNTTRSSNEEKQLICKVLKLKGQNGLKGTIYIINKCTRVIVLLTLCCWQACATSDESQPVTPTDPEVPAQPKDGMIAADMAFCVSTAQGSNTGTTRMAVDVVQGQSTPVFRGIQDITLIPYNADNNVLPFTMPTMERKGATYYNYLSTTSPQLSIGTKHFFGFARAKYPDGTSDSSAPAFMFTNGRTILTIPEEKNLADITFGLEPICANKDAAGYNVAEAMANYLTNIARVSNFKTEASTLYSDFTNSDQTDATKNGSPIAGSTANVKKWVELLKGNVDKLPDTNPLKNPLTTAIGTIDSHFTGDAYPVNIGLPDGAAALQWIAQAPSGASTEEAGTYPKFVVLKASDSGTPMSDHARFTYPSELFYYTYSNVMTSQSSQAAHYPEKNWLEVLQSYTDGDVVSSLTRSVAIKQPLNYGTCCLVLTFKAASTTLLDNSEANGSLTKSINLTTNKFPLTGIMIGGQYQQVYQTEDDTHLYSFAPTTAAGATEHIIYDKTIPGEIKMEANDAGPVTSAPVYSLVLQTREEKPVDIVLEFENNSDDWFAGYQGGIIYPGTKFYLIGQAWPSTIDGDEDVKKRVFTQDHVTTLQLTIQSLKNAYNVIPELRTAAHAIKVANVGVKKWTETEEQNHSIYNW